MMKRGPVIIEGVTQRFEYANLSTASPGSDRAREHPRHDGRSLGLRAWKAHSPERGTLGPKSAVEIGPSTLWRGQLTVELCIE
jgi:hypothetical protein